MTLLEIRNATIVALARAEMYAESRSMARLCPAAPHLRVPLALMAGVVWDRSSAAAATHTGRAKRVRNEAADWCVRLLAALVRSPA